MTNRRNGPGSIATRMSPPERGDLLHRRIFIPAEDSVNFAERTILWTANVRQQHHLLVAPLPFHWNGGDVLVVFVKMRPGHGQIGLPHLRNLAGHERARFDEKSGPAWSRAASLASVHQTGQVHSPFHGDARNLAAEVHEIDDETPAGRHRNHSAARTCHRQRLFRNGLVKDLSACAKRCLEPKLQSMKFQGSRHLFAQALRDE